MELLNTLTTTRGKVLFTTRSLSALCDAADVVGNCVYISGTPISGVIQVRTVDISDTAKMPSIGVIESKSSPTDCRVVWSGEYVQSGFTINKPVFISPTGTLTNTPSLPTTVPLTHQIMGTSIAPNRILISPNLPTVRRKP